MKISKWGDSLAIRLPAAMIAAHQLREGDEIEFHVAGARELTVTGKVEREELLERLRAFRGRLPADFNFDRDEVNRR